ncbi:hypothetical protein FGIG_01238 [Fasciola gigantica]|uniref:Uncharacterized protein n=1 Tax=Fasciola gigantica TaxID=46835 RepID=A0A504Y9F4_FASGI|nr:hypothetical protein FGIG_01238 [Fasciola gigantica]
MSSPSPALRSMSSTPARKDDISRSLRVRQRIPSPFVYTSAVSPNVRENCHGGETIIHRVDEVKNASALIRPISLAALQKVTGLKPFDPGEFSSSRGIFSRRNSFSARQWSGEHDIKVSEKDNVENIKFSNRVKENIGVRGSQALIKPAHMVAHTVKDYPNLPGKSPISCGDNPFAYSPGSKKSGIYNQGASWNPKPELSRKGSCGSEANPYHMTLTRNMGSHYLQQQLKLLSRPKMLPNFDAKFIGQTQTSAAFYGPPKVDHGSYRNISAKDAPLFDPLTIGLQKPNVVMRKCKEPRKFHKLSNRKESTIFEPKLHFAEVHQINLQDKRSKNNSDNTMGGEYQLVDALVTSSPEKFEKFLYTVQPKRTRVHSSLDNQTNYAISVKNPTAQTVVLLRNQTNAYLRSAVSSRLLNYELTGENTDPITPRKLMAVPSLASLDDLNRTITVRTQTVRSSMTVSVQDQKPRPTENETVGSIQPRFNSIKPDAISSPHVYVCRPAKQTEMDSGNGTDEDEALTRNSGDSVKKAILYGSDENAGQYEDEVNEMEDDADGSDEASDSSGVIESDENPHGDEDPLPEDEASSTNEDTVTTISSSLTKSTAAQIVDGQLDAFLTGSETMPFDRKKLELVLQKQLAEQNASATVNTGNDTQTDVDQTFRGVQFYRTPLSANQTNRISPFTSRSTLRSPLVPTHGSSGLEGAETNEGCIQTSRECGHTTSNSHAMTDPSNSKKDTVTNRESLTQTTESDKGLIVSLEFKAGSNRIDDTLLSQSETGLCMDLVNRQSPGTMCTKETMRRTTRKYFVPRRGSGESTPHPALISSLFPKVPPVLRFVDEGCKCERNKFIFKKFHVELP